jgi:putative DNA primase/helicase
VVNVISGDSHKNREVRRDLQPLVELGHKLKAVILRISHFTKGTIGQDPLERVTGSIAFGAMARVVLATAKVTEPDGNLKRLLVRAKSNNGPDNDGYYYQIKQIELADYPGVSSSQVIWGSPVEGNARELLSDPNEQSAPDERSTFAEAVKFLKVLLAMGPIPKKEVDEKAREAGFKDITLRRAKAFLGVDAVHDGYGKGSVWKWHLPSKMLKDHKDPHQNRVNSKEHLSWSLTQIHPPIIEGCKLLDILHHADLVVDYEALKDPEVLSLFAQDLKKSGKVISVDK